MQVQDMKDFSAKAEAIGGSAERHVNYEGIDALSEQTEVKTEALVTSPLSPITFCRPASVARVFQVASAASSVLALPVRAGQSMQ
eukprot:408099-Hanusia_phi.AAC.1